MRPLSRRAFNFGLVAAGAAFSTPFRVWGQETKPRGGTLNVVASNEYPTLVPLYHNIGIAGVSGRVLEGLFEVDSDLTPAPSLCKSWTVSPDGLVYTFVIRDGVLWHDGNPLSEADVEFSLQLVKKTNARRKVTFQYLDKIDASETGKVVLYFTRPVPFLVNTLTAVSCPILPRHLWEGKDPRTNPQNARPIGTGPFVFKEWERGSYHLLDRNPRYWRSDLPYLDHVIVKYIIDPGARMAAFEAGTVAIGFESPIPVEELERVQRQHPNLVTSTNGYDESGALNQLFLNLRTKQLQDLRVREAIAHAINVPDYIQRVWRGYAVAAPSPIPPSQVDFYDKKIRHRTFDLAKAEGLLDAAGYPRLADGSRFTLRMTYNPYFRELKGGAEFIRSALDSIGIKVTLARYDSATYVRTVVSGWRTHLPNSSI
ncbi:ABC transporter substrate-binding protein [Pseudomonas kitaguniensis]|uniref:ABC transporter substrate-binding protein n=1 Tax=Pseudomonas kitaguniensis TaxID=2607908 RepID=UPI003D0722C4